MPKDWKGYLRMNGLLAVVALVSLAALGKSFLSGALWRDPIQPLTLLILLVYTCETRRIAAASVLQAEAQYRPLLRAFADEEFTAFRVKNVGTGPALSVTIKAIEFNVPEQLGFRCGFDTIPLLEPGEETFSFIRRADDGDAEFAWTHLTKEGPKDYELTIDYEGIDKRQWRTRCTAGKSGPRILGFDER